MSLTFLDFFAGVGGFRRGMELADHTCLGHCEIDKFANMSYTEIHEPKEGEWFGTDIRRTNADELPRADVWCFGFPCQDISVAGKQLGFKGQRSSLFFTVTRLIRDTKEEDRPKYLFIENVKNLLSVNGGCDFLKLLIELDEIGYDAEWQVLNSKNFGVPQNRERVFIIGHLRGSSGRKVFPIETENRKTINIVGYLDEGFKDVNYELNPNGIAKCLTTMQGGNRQPKVLICGNVHPSGKGMNGQVYNSKGLAPTLTTNKGEGPKILIKENTKKGYVEAYEGDGIRLDHIGGTTGRGRVQPQMCNTLTTGSHAGVIDKGFRIRKLTPKECWRLQGWKDEDFEKAAKVCSDSQLYKQAGNGVTVPVIYEIAKRL
ncbi:DNA cytosine methyltransferase [Clostridium tertium]|jgi:DNA (cytosine-5)-methyltransferase 1|uniref:DNA cytosine methyltransferase n=1 Tax=Clostridium tertium TaxID=1559 RepID=UPI001C1E6A33|nr:DNA cytosine methyltransferase [Clostridium tertium]MBU6137328.1 DNA cytosine methyltransferase [Clostridium tertium]